MMGTNTSAMHIGPSVQGLFKVHAAKCATLCIIIFFFVKWARFFKKMFHPKLFDPFSESLVELPLFVFVHRLRWIIPFGDEICFMCRTPVTFHINVRCSPHRALVASA